MRKRRGCLLGGHAGKCSGGVRRPNRGVLIKEGKRDREYFPKEIAVLSPRARDNLQRALLATLSAIGGVHVGFEEARSRIQKTCNFAF